jgi:hypothetical protein
MVKIEYAPPIIMACCVLHKYFQLMGMDALGYDYVENMHDRKDHEEANVITSLNIMQAMLQK